MARQDASMQPLVSVVIPCYNQGHFLGEAIQSVRDQSHRPLEIIVVDDGSTDETAAVTRGCPEVRYIHQQNQGLGAARNTGLEASQGTYVVFLDADDLLYPQALAAGLQSFQQNSDAAFVSGGHVRVNANLEVIEAPPPLRPRQDPYLALLRGNYIGMHATVMYRRDCLLHVGGFDATLPACEDYELYLRLARDFPVGCHDEVVAAYRIHSDNMSHNARLMLRTVQQVLRAQRPHVISDPARRRAWREGLRVWQGYYGQHLSEHMQNTPSAPGSYSGYWTLLRYAPGWLATRTGRKLLRTGKKHAKRMMPGRVRQWVTRLAGRSTPPVGTFRFGSLRRVTPFSRVFGYDRGTPVDRYYIERFLERHAHDIRGRVLEIGDRAYTRRFGRDRVEQSDVLHVSEGNPHATIIGDLATGDHIPSDAFDCVILTQTLHLIYDLRAAMATLYRMLKPGGVLLATVPGLSHIDHGEWGNTWYWSFTAQSARRLFEEVFPASTVELETHGNVLVATAFLYGLSKQELRRSELDYSDPDYQVMITLRAVKPLPAAVLPAAVVDNPAAT